MTCLEFFSAIADTLTFSGLLYVDKGISIAFVPAYTFRFMPKKIMRYLTGMPGGTPILRDNQAKSEMVGRHGLSYPVCTA